MGPPAICKPPSSVLNVKSNSKTENDFQEPYLNAGAIYALMNKNHGLMVASAAPSTCSRDQIIQRLSMQQHFPPSLYSHHIICLKKYFELKTKNLI